MVVLAKARIHYPGQRLLEGFVATIICNNISLW